MRRFFLGLLILILSALAGCDGGTLGELLSGDFLGTYAFKATVDVNNGSSSSQMTFTSAKDHTGYPNDDGFVWTLTNSYQVIPTSADNNLMLMILPSLAAGSYSGDTSTQNTACIMIESGIGSGSQVMSYSGGWESTCNFTVTQGGSANGDRIKGSFSGELYDLTGQYKHWTLSNGKFEGVLTSMTVFGY
jgi:hypothetical protein